MMGMQFKKLSEQNEAGETNIQVIEKKLGELSIAITGKTSDARETKGQTMGTGVTKIGKGVDSRNLRAVPKSESGNRLPKSDGVDRIPHFGKRMR